MWIKIHEKIIMLSSKNAKKKQTKYNKHRNLFQFVTSIIFIFNFFAFTPNIICYLYIFSKLTVGMNIENKQ